MMRPGSVTHSFNMEQRLVELHMVGQAGDALTLEVPPAANVAPPGYYMLFVLNAAGVPSEGAFVALG